MKLLRLRRSGEPEPLAESAAEWVLRAEAGLSRADETRLEQWLAEPRHAAAFDDAIWALDSVQTHAGASELLALREAALSKAPRRSTLPWMAGGSAVAAAAAALIWVGGASELVQPFSGSRSVQTTLASTANGAYRTGIGERSAIVLPDSSIATLDTNSQLRVNYSAAERAVVLVKGQALFEVAKGKTQPFVVLAGSQRIIAVGTTFNVKLTDGQVQVSMVEGVVKVRPTLPNSNKGAPNQELTLRAGDSLVAQQAQPASIKPVDASQVAAWRGGLLVFEDERLSDAIAEINRYTDKPVHLADASLGEYRVTGVFKTNDATRFANAMSEVFPVSVEARPDGSTMIKADR